jgi:hypothetical protein
VSGTGGVIQFTGSTATNQLTAGASNTTLGLISSLAVSSDGSVLYATSPNDNALDLLDSSSLDVLDTVTAASLTTSTITPADGTLAGASGVAVHAPVPGSTEEYVYIIGETTGTLTVLARDESTGDVTWVQTLQEGVSGARGLAGATDLIVSQDGQYVYVTSGQENSLTIFGIQPDGSLVHDQVLSGSVGLGDPSAVAGDPMDGNVYVASQSGFGQAGGGLASFSLVPPSVSSVPASLKVSWNQMSTIDVNVGNYTNTVNEQNYATTGIGSTTAAILNLTAGNGANTINLPSVAGTTTVTTGSGQDSITVDATQTNLTLTVNGGAGKDDVELDKAASRDTITINLGSDDSTALIEGTALALRSTVTVNGATTGNATLLFDAKGNPINAYETDGTPIPSNQPALPDGEIQAITGTNARLRYSNITYLPGYVGAVVSASTSGSAYTIAEGDSLTLSGSATPATNTTIVSESWDLNGDGTFGDAVGLNPTLSWSELVALGLNGPGIYPIAFRVVSGDTTVTAYSSLTITSVAPAVSINGSGTATLGQPYTIDFSAQEVSGVNYEVTGWSINWGDGTTSELPSGSMDDPHTYATPGNYSIVATATDPYGSYSSADSPVTVEVTSNSISAGGPYTITSGQSLTLVATAAGSPISFAWNLTGFGVFSSFEDQTIQSSSGETTSQVTLTWTQLQSLLGANDEGTFSEVRAAASYSDGSMAISAVTTLTINATAPTASFAGTDTTLGGSSSVTFTNPSDPSALQRSDGYTYSYDFLDNGNFEIADSPSATAPVPSDLLARPGTFIVHGRITSTLDGTFSDYYTTITVSDVAPSVTVASQQQSVAAGVPYVLTGNQVSFTDPGYGTDKASWGYTATIDWGDGTTSVGALTITQGSAGTPTTGTVSGTHLYRPNQSATVTVTVTDSDGESGSGSFTVVVGKPVLTLMPAPSQTIPVGSTFELTQTSFTDSAAPDTETATINWGDGTATQTVPSANLFEPAAAGDPGSISGSHIYGQPGLYTITVGVADPYGDSRSGTISIDVLDVAPTVFAGPNVNQSPGVATSIFSTFSDPAFPVGDSALTYSATINWGDGSNSGPGTLTITPGGAGKPTTGTISGTHTYARHGNYTVTVTVTDGLGLESDATIGVLDVPPTVMAGANQTVNLGSPLDVDASFTDPGYEIGASAANYPATINWGDGTITAGLVVVTPGGPGVATVGTVTGSHTYSDQGNYTVTVSVGDDGGGSGTSSLTATINDQGPTLAPLADMTYVVNQPVSFQETFTEPGINDQDSVTVTWGDGTTSNITAEDSYENSDGTLVPYLVEPSGTNPGTVTLEHTYGDAGPYDVTITITDKDGKSDSVSATFAGAQSAATTTSLTSSTAGASSTYGQSVIFTANVLAGSPATVAPTGTVTFYDGTDQIGQPVLLSSTLGDQATASLSWAGLTAGTAHSITAVYSGGAGDQGSSSAPLIQTVTTAPTALTLASSANPAVFGQPVTFTATLAPNAANGTAIPYLTGTVSFYDGTTMLGLPVAVVDRQGVITASLTWSSLGVSNSHTIKAIYHGSTDDAASIGTVAQMINPAQIAATVGVSSATIQAGQSVTLTATITPAAPGAGTPTGTVHFVDSTTGMTLGSATIISGTASLPTSALRAGTNVITAAYGGSTNFLAGSSSTGVAIFVVAGLNQTATTTKVTASPTVSVFDQTVVFTATITTSPSNPATPITGSVEFFNGTVPLGQPVVVTTLGGVSTASLAYTGLPVSSNNITAVYTGDALHNPSSGGTTEVVSPDTTVVTVSESVGDGDVGSAVSFSATVRSASPAVGTPTGTVDFRDTTRGTDLGTVTLSGGVATMTTTLLPAGSQAITASYNGSASFLPNLGDAAAISLTPSIYVLDSTAAAALDVASQATILTPGLLQVDSTSSTAVVATVGAQVEAGIINVVGGVGGNSIVLNPAPITGAPALPDPLSSLPLPSQETKIGSVVLTGNSTETISPGIYTEISVSGQASLTLNPGIYEIVGGGFSVQDNASVTGTGILIYNAGNDFTATSPGGGGSGGTSAGGSPTDPNEFGAITVGNSATVQLTASASGPYAGIAIFQARDNTQPMTLDGTSVQTVNGTIYAPVAPLLIDAAQLTQTSLIVDKLNIQDSGSFIPSVVTPNAVPSGPLSHLGGQRAAVRIASTFPSSSTIAPSAIVSSVSKSSRSNVSNPASVTALSALSTTAASRPITIAAVEASDGGNPSGTFDSELIEQLATSLVGDDEVGSHNGSSKTKTPSAH